MIQPSTLGQHIGSKISIRYVPDFSIPRTFSQNFINPSAGPKMLIIQSRISSVLIVVAGIGLTLIIHNINQVWAFFTMSVVSALSIPLVGRWFWWYELCSQWSDCTGE